MSTGTTVPTTNGTFDPDDVKRKDIDEKLYTAFNQDQIEVLDACYGGGGSGGVTRYAQLPDKPSINGIELAGDKTPEALGIVSYDDTALSARVSANASAIADRYTKSETDSKIAEAIDDVDLEHFHVVTQLPAIADAIENHEYVLVTYVSGTTEIATEEHYLFYDGAYHKRNVHISFEGYATEQYVDNAVGTKQDTLESGVNIKKIGNVDLLGSGAIAVATVNNKSLLDGGNVSTAKIIYDAEYQTTQISDAESNAQIGINKVGANTLNISEYAPDSRGQLQEVFNMNIPTVDAVQDAVGTHIAVGKETWYGTYTDEDNVVYQVYTKTVYIPALPATAGVTAYEHGVDNIKQILSIYGFTTDGFVLNAPRQTVTDNITIYQASKSASNKTFSIEVGKDRSNKKAYVTMVYAKNN